MKNASAVYPFQKNNRIYIRTLLSE